jgi:hypothetical protein
MNSTRDSRDFWRNDPVLGLLRDRLNLSGTKIIITIFLFTAVLHHLFGIIADSIYTGRGVRYADPDYLYFNLAWLLFFVPFIWLFYLWQPRAVDRVLDTLKENDVIGPVIKETNSPVKSLAAFRERFAFCVTRKFWYILALIPVVLFWVYSYFVSWPAEFELAGEPAFWFSIEWFTALFIIGYSVTFYVLWVFVLRHIQITHFFNRLFYWFDVKIKAVYPDEAGGLGAIGEFTVRTGMIAVGVGVMAVAYGFYIWSNTGSYVRADVIAFFLLYIVITPLAVILPMLGAHQAMKRARGKNLEEVSQEFSRVLSGLDATITADAEAIKKTNEKLSELKQTYQLIYDAFPVWPISLRLARNFSITASLPLLSGLISVAIEYVIS